ncbi:HAD hydrolase-like protein [Desulfoluna sp.]|uniref:HAD hydrolase-like protein n=1 Tax=Desulfoluna sp. TaxID=2045199 RepID=UPI002608F592|nr:HAD hydrolase-like protein [Desulfoluna sp.]
MNLLFDLDGTLTDSFQGITKCIQHALVSLDRPEPPAESLRWCIGPSLKESFTKLLGAQDESLVDEAIDLYRERFGSIGLYENKVYPTIEETLHELKEGGHHLCVATSKPTVFARRILHHFDLASYFSTIDGSELNGVRCDKASLIAHIIARDAMIPADTVMIGDREHDMIGACRNGIAGWGVLWGYGSREELDAAGACACIETPGDVCKKM